MKKEKSKIVAGLLSLFLGDLGIHKFYLGYTGTGLIYIAVSVLGVFLLFVPNGILLIVKIVEALIYMTKSDEDFHRIYVEGRRRVF